MFMLEPDDEKQAQMMQGNTFVLPGIPPAEPSSKAKKQDSKDKVSDKEVEDEDSSGQGSEQEDEAGSNTSEKLLDDI